MTTPGPVLDRLMGLETEYALRFTSPRSQGPGKSGHPGNDRIYRALAGAVSELVHARPGDGVPSKEQIFVQNGGAFYYEHLPHCPAGGLLEGATPECRSPAQLLTYQKAQEELLKAALPRARRRLAFARRRGRPSVAELRLEGGSLGELGWGDLGLVKNCRDAAGNVYGAQENYEVEIARGPWLMLYRAGLALLVPWFLLMALLSWVMNLVLILLVLVVAVWGWSVAVLFPRWSAMRRVAALLQADEDTLGRRLGWFQLVLSHVFMGPVATPFAVLLELTAFRHLRAPLWPFLASRAVIAGAGTVEAGGRFALAEKAPALRRLLRRSISPKGRPVLDTGNLLKQALSPMTFRFSELLGLFRRRQRLQLGFGDSNAAQWAEYLKIATTALVLDLAEADELKTKAPRLRRPLAAFHALAADPTLKQAVELKDGTERTALELQRFYLERAEDWLARAPAVSMEARQVVKLWRQVLEALEERRWDTLLGKLDWVTKRYLLESCGTNTEGPGTETSGTGSAGKEAVLKTLDLRYHELGEGYLARMEAAGLAPRVVEPETVERAMEEPPEKTPAFLRGELIRRRGAARLPLKVTWDSAWIGGRLLGQVVHFRDPRANGRREPQI
ncbi:MAG: proteasome accessory factor PafA2 family protein [Acidobacteriota bacterium]|nr:proteasome accessory factor PafA2 family protein [Acidobacteriota bacterium]